MKRLMVVKLSSGAATLVRFMLEPFSGERAITLPTRTSTPATIWSISATGGFSSMNARRSRAATNESI